MLRFITPQAIILNYTSLHYNALNYTIVTPQNTTIYDASTGVDLSKILEVQTTFFGGENVLKTYKCMGFLKYWGGARAARTCPQSLRQCMLDYTAQNHNTALQHIR